MRSRVLCSVFVLLTGLIAFSSMPALAGLTARNGMSPAPAVTAANYTADSEECAFLGLINDYRTSKGLGKLKLAKGLGAASEHHSLDMATKNYFGNPDPALSPHTMLDGTTVIQNIRNHGNQSIYWAENIAAGNATATKTFDQWKNSPGHNTNMLGSHYSVIGIGRAYNADAQYDWYWTTIFGDTMDTEYTSCGATQPTPTPTPTPVKLSITGSACSNNAELCAFVRDASIATSWFTTSTTPTSARVTIDLGSSRQITKVRWRFSQSGSADRYKIQISSDGVTWTTITNRTSPPADTWLTKLWSGQARYVRFVFSNPNADPQLGYLTEVEIYR